MLGSMFVTPSNRGWHLLPPSQLTKDVSTHTSQATIHSPGFIITPTLLKKRSFPLVSSQNSPNQASTVHEPRTFKCSNWIQKRQRNQRSNFQHHRKTQKKQESSRKTSASLTILKLLIVWITTNCGKFLKRWEYQTTLPAS